MMSMKFDVEKTISYWLESAEYDLKVAENLFITEVYPYSLFFGHLAIEKLLKALVVRDTKDHAPHTHSLPLLASKITLEIPETIGRKLVTFMEFYFEARYPDEKKSFYAKCTKDFTEKNLNDIKEVFRWLKEKL
jgi:HEPN domain-containing protein